MVDRLIEELIAREGGFVAHRADRGGPTRWGITEAVARAHGYGGAMAALPQDMAARIYRADYWTAPGLDRVAAHAPRLAAELFDTAVNMGPAIATGFLRRALNALNRGRRDYPDLPPSGMADTTVIAALAAFLTLRGAGGETVLIRAVDALQGARYVALAERRPANEAFLYGWLANRIG
jgi:lysozyme family protein